MDCLGKIKVGIFGGTFDPVHNAHIGIAKNAVESFALDRLLFMPCAVPPHKPGRITAPAEDRLAMLRIAAAEVPGAEVSSFEINKGGLSYTVETLEILRRDHPEWDIWFIIGMDSLNNLHKWKRCEELPGLCTFATMMRPEQKTPVEIVPGFSPEVSRRLLAHVAHGPMIDVSSSEIRLRIAKNLPIEYLVPRAVAEYIREHRLYEIQGVGN